ncbi:MAG: hypothetical protein A2X49_02065 [Lentisphaerae bacterium GWF2_52_8]|nr:MAG: hypothetical protein A2X49_02065 [Lentisphaerae bacterium GWF2_52_8]
MKHKRKMKLPGNGGAWSTIKDSLVKILMVPHFSGVQRRPLNLCFNQWNMVVPPRNLVCKLHIHDNYELIAPVSGCYECSLNGSRIALKAGKMIFIQAGDSHEDYYKKGSPFVGFHFQLNDLNMGVWPHGVLDMGLPPEARVLDMRTQTWPRKIFDMIAILISKAPSKSRLSELTIDSLSNAFFWSLVSAIPENCLSPQFRNCLHDDEFRGKVLAAFEKALKLRLGVRQIASLLGMSERALDYKFANVIGASPYKAFTCYKLDKAIALLEAGSTVKEAADALGFADQFHFSKVFKRHMGLNPSSILRK